MAATTRSPRSKATSPTRSKAKAKAKAKTKTKAADKVKANSRAKTKPVGRKAAPAAARGKQADLGAEAVRAYLARLPTATRAALDRVRGAIRAAAPGAVEAFSYGIPAFRFEGRIVIWCAGWKNHLSLYPINDELARAHRIDISGYKTARGTIQFPLSAPPPLALVKRLVKARLAVVRAGTL